MAASGKLNHSVRRESGNLGNEWCSTLLRQSLLGNVTQPLHLKPSHFGGDTGGNDFTRGRESGALEAPVAFSYL